MIVARKERRPPLIRRKSCCVCGQLVTLRPDGELRPHTTGDVERAKLCVGSDPLLRHVMYPERC